MEQQEPEFEILFEMPAELVKSEGDGKRGLKGFATTEREDHDGEMLIKSGLDFQPLKTEGYLNYDHQRRVIAGAKMPIIIGVPTLVEMRDKGLWVEGELFNGDPMLSEQNRLANEMWELGLNLQKAGRSLSYSIEGQVLQRRGKKLVKTRASMAAVTHKPVNPECSVEMFAKSLCCGRCSPDHPQFNPAHSCGNKHVEIQDGLPHLAAMLEKAATTENHGALLLQNLDRGLTSVLYGEVDCGCFDRKSGHFYKGIGGAHQHMVNCLGQDSQGSFQVLRRVVRGAEKSADLAVLAKAAGFIR